MSDFPKGGDIQATRTWLDQKGFTGKLIDFEADSILGLNESHIHRLVGDEVQSIRLWGLLNTAHQKFALQGKLFYSLISSIASA